jgi:hypothetical protein
MEAFSDFYHAIMALFALNDMLIVQQLYSCMINHPASHAC